MSAMLLIILWWEAGVKKAARKQNEFKVVVQALLRSTIIKVVRFHCYTEGGYLPRHTCVGGLGESEMRVIPAFIIKSRFGSAWLLFIRRMTVMHVKLFKKKQFLMFWVPPASWYFREEVSFMHCPPCILLLHLTPSNSWEWFKPQRVMEIWGRGVSKFCFHPPLFWYTANINVKSQSRICGI